MEVPQTRLYDIYDHEKRKTLEDKGYEVPGYDREASCCWTRRMRNTVRKWRGCRSNRRSMR